MKERKRDSSFQGKVLRRWVETTSFMLRLYLGVYAVRPRCPPDPCNNALLVELRPVLHIHLHPQVSKRLHLRFHLGRIGHQERVK